MTSFGFPVGPVTLLDEVGIDVGAKVAKVMHHHFGERMSPAPLDGEAARRRPPGPQERSSGFYTYDGGEEARGRVGVRAAAGRAPAAAPIEPRDAQERLGFAFLNESVLCLQEGILRSPRDGDVGAIFGLGFPPFLGGPFRYLDHLGARFVLERLEKLQARHGGRFRPAPMLVDHGPGGPQLPCDRTLTL